MTIQSAKPDRFYPALDGLRALAIAAVLISHFFPDRALIQRSFHWGRFGVLLFFVLSGAISIVLAKISWYAIEAPINRQKRRFPYPPTAAPVAAETVPAAV